MDTNKLTIKLERHAPWTDNRSEYRYPWRDPVDDPAYDGACSFPRLKPDTDALPSPWGRTRKQRGWYQIIRRGLLVEQLPTPTSAFHGRDTVQRAKGSDLPPEILSLIAKEVDVSGCNDRASNALRKTERRQISAYTLVCRHWAELFSSVLFCSSVLASRNALLVLLALLRSSAGNGRIGRYVKQFDIEYSPSHPPWLHLLPAVFSCLLNKPQVDLFITGPPEATSAPSLHHSLPRTLPTSFCSGIMNLSLKHMTFRRFDDLIRLCCELPDLVSFDGQGLQWAVGPTSTATPFRRRLVASRLGYVSLRDCTANWPAVFLANTTAARLSREDCTRLGVLARLIEDSGTVDHAYFATPPELLKGADDRFRASFACGRADTEFYLEVTVMARTAMGDYFRSGEDSGFRIDGVQIRYKTGPAGKWIPVNWAAFDETISTLRTLESVLVSLAQI